jgi:hypothetical protein
LRFFWLGIQNQILLIFLSFYIKIVNSMVNRDFVQEQQEEPNKNPIPLKKLRQIITLCALFLAIAHLILPNVKIDTVTLAFVIIAVLPWLALFIKSIELPGGWKIVLQDLQKAASRADTAGLLAVKPSISEDSVLFQSISKRDPNLALAWLRIEIEKKLSKLAEVSGIKQQRLMGVGQFLRYLTQQEVLTKDEHSILSDILNMLNAAVHGATVDRQSADWASDVGPRLLTSLDERIEEANQT